MTTPRYHSLIAEYMQGTGQLGRRASMWKFEWRTMVSRSVTCFRGQSPLEELLLEDETTEFAFAEDARVVSAGRAQMWN